MPEGEPREISERDYHAIIGAVEIINFYQRAIDDTSTIVAGIVGAENESVRSPVPYYGLLTDELGEGRPGKETADKICRHFNLKVAVPAIERKE